MSNKILKDFQKTIERLEDVLKIEETEITRDSAIKRFELCFDLARKTIKEYARKCGMECYSPRDCFKAAFQLKLIEHNERWLEMVKDRNLTTHLYKEEQAEKIYQKLLEYLKMFKNLFPKFKNGKN